ncbi:MAG: imidazole glycerol phosphate synthase subunit HisH [Gammaproteobacteria bacterium]|nr:imidazole glycerol phosphate synthase subunit HisH [Gammaproteobacteria bacterium]
MSARSVAIVATGGANIASLSYALERLGVRATLAADPATIRDASHVILPGVGAAGDAMRRLRASGLDRVITQLPQPVLGICLGMQLLFDASAEGPATCLGILPGRVERLDAGPDRPVPHIGWNTLEPRAASPLLEGLRAGDRAYFVHSFAAPVADATIATTTYGTPFSACVQRDRFFGVQFHPERSAAVGARVLANFLGVD